MIQLRLPFPPSANHYNAIRIVKNRYGKSIPMHYRTKRAKRFYDAVCLIVLDELNGLPLEGRLAVSIELSPPTRRVFDISNAIKCIEDALQEAGLFFDDAQIDQLHVKRLSVDVNKVGCADVIIQEIADGL